MYIYGLFLKILYKLKLSKILYPVFYLLNHVFPKARLPKLSVSKRIIFNNIYNKSRFSVNAHSIKKNYHQNKFEFDVQIIIPSYNSAKYLDQCLNSILDQKTKYKFQIILVNDGSTDNTSKILNKYRNNSLVEIINEKNSGRSFARNTGLNYVTSKYIMFVDSDDKLAPNAIENLLNKANKSGADIVFGGCRIFYNDRKLGNDFNYNNVDNLHIKSDKDVDDSVCGKVFKASLFKGVRFPVGYEFEDMMPAFWIYPRSQKMSSISNNIYWYRYNSSSITHSFQFTKISIDSFLILSLIIKSLQRYNVKINQYIYESFLGQVKTTCMRNIYINTKIQKSIFVGICNLYNKYFSKFRTNINYYKPLEDSLKNKNYNEYILFCIMK